MILKSHFLESSDRTYRREIRVRTVEGAKSLAVFLDGEFYEHRVGAVPILEGLMDAGVIPPMHLVFVSHVDAAMRQVDFLWNEAYADFVGRDLLGWARGVLPEVAHSPYLLAGLSLSALEAALIASRYPTEFPWVLCQSGSFWWLEDHPKPLPPMRKRFWLSVGDEEADTDVTHPPTPLFQRVSQIGGVEAMATKLQNAGAQVRFQPYPGGHSFEPWREELPEALAWLFT